MDLLCFFLSSVCYAVVRLFIYALWSPAGKGSGSCLLFVCLFLLLYVPCQQLSSLRDGQFTPGQA